MSASYYSLSPCDAWFFRDGRPYHHGESNQADVPSVFPPSPRTLSGALRAALARAHGWHDGHRWPPALNPVLGDGPHHLGTLQFTGPFLIRGIGPSARSLWPMPRHLLGSHQKGRWIPRAFLIPDSREIPSDLGSRRLPRPNLPPGQSQGGFKPPEAVWVTSRGLERILTGRLPEADEIVPAEELWTLESRIGLRRQPDSLIVGPGDLYSPCYVRLHPRVSLGVGIQGLPESMHPLPPLLALGGESRLAAAEPWPQNPLPAAPGVNSFQPDSRGMIRFVLLLLTPARFTSPANPASNLPLPAEVISACVARPQWIGGWDSLNHEPLALEPFYPAGSVWFCETPAEKFPQIYNHHGQWLGDYTRHGFGQIAIGLWPPNPTQ
ncbi:type III-B CRISPR module-associated Cmr3 family protein [Limisphaera sp. VF-2]|jgi:CRISPR-associated protein Cmr3|uniref:type III-B CRISPR module-associated Cmr3 family protein n=1 Tax=Limisphaera sp. VF-2 TaxID=3400418 RepID=UPI0030B333E6